MKTNIFPALILLMILCITACDNDREAEDNNRKAIEKSPQVDSIPVKVDDTEEITGPLALSLKPNPEMLKGLSHRTIIRDSVFKEEFLSLDFKQVFPDKYTEIPGILTFRGNNLRDNPAWGSRDIREEKLEKKWTYVIESDTGHWIGAAGWTGQPAIIRWPDSARKAMDIYDKFKSNSDFTEIIQASLNGKIYFIGLETGKESRPPMRQGGPVKGSVSIDPRGYPLLYVGQGIPKYSDIGFRLFNLIDRTEIYFQNGLDRDCYRRWGAFDCSGLFNRMNDYFITGAENGLLYLLKLNTEIDLKKGVFKINPKTIKYKYHHKIQSYAHLGIENSVAAWRNIAWFADNAGILQAIDMQKMKPIWLINLKDDIDATITVEIENDTPMLYAGSEVDKQGETGFACLMKINGISGETVWERNYECKSQRVPSHIDGGLLATNIIGKDDISDCVIFSLAHCPALGRGLLVALDKQTGKELRRLKLGNYAWSSPLAVKSNEGRTYIIQCNFGGEMLLIDANSFEIKDRLKLGYNIEASPVVFDNKIVVASRGPHLHCIEIK